jgi:hypothetical protein
MAVDSKQSSHSLKSPQVAKQPDNLIKKEQKSLKTIYLKNHILKGLMELLFSHHKKVKALS